MRTLKALSFVLAAGLLPAQTFITAGDAHLTLAQVVRMHPEGVVLCLPAAQGQSLAQAVEAALDQEPARALQLGSQELQLEERVGRELQRLAGWGSDKPHWALVGPDRHIHAEGTTAPGAAALAEAYRQSPLRSRAELLRDFLKDHEGHADAQARLLLEARNLAERRTETLLAPKAEGPKNAVPRPLSEDEDARIWGDYADLYERFIAGGDWLDAAVDDTAPAVLAAPLSHLAVHSPRLRSLARQLLPAVEGHLRRRPSDARRWEVWTSLRAAAGPGKASEVLSGLKPPPGAARWPPAAALDAYVEDARRSGDWREAEPLLQAAYDQRVELLHDMEAAVKEDAGRRPGNGPVRVQMGSYGGLGNWNEDLSLLLEAKLRLGKKVEADETFQGFYALVPKAATAQRAAALAHACGAEDLADRWGRMAK